MREEAKLMLIDARRIEAQVVKHVLDTAQVLCATTTALDSEVLGQREFDLAVIDEACQTTEPGCWIPLIRAEKLVLAGDHCQLPPTVLSTEAAHEGFDVSLRERLALTHGAAISRRLEIQYRMHEAIMRFSSDEFYDGALIADESVRAHLLCELPGVETMACVVHQGDIWDVGQPITALYTWLSQHGLTSAGPYRELHLYWRELTAAPEALCDITLEMQVPAAALA
jgi:hypothetical protein